MLVHLEGNIASGKSTLGQSLAAHPRFHFIPEPVEVWQTGFTDNVLDRFYGDMGRWSFTFQICTFATRVAALRDQPDGRITVAERSIGCDRYVFALSLYEQGALDAVEWEVYRRLWDAASGEELAVLEGHTDAVESVAFSPDGTRLASANDDGTIRLWDATSGAALAVLEGHTTWVRSVVFSPDGTRLVSASSDGTIRIWGVPAS